MPRLFEVASDSWTGESKDGFKIGKSLLDGALAQIRLFAPSLCLCWATNHYQSQFPDIMGGAWESLTGHYQRFYRFDPVASHGWRCPLVGCSVSAALQRRAVAHQGVFVTVLASRYIRARAEVLPVPDTTFWNEYLSYVSDPDERFIPPQRIVEDRWPELIRALGRLRQGTASRHGFLLCLLPGFIHGGAPGTTTAEYWDSHLLRLIRRGVGYETPIWGGSAGDSGCLPGQGYDQAQSFVFKDEKCYQSHLLLAWVETKLKVGISICSDYSFLTRSVLRPTLFAEPGGRPQEELECGKVVVRFNDRPAADVFAAGEVVVGAERFPVRNTLLEYREPLSGEMTTAHPYRVRGEAVYFSEPLEKEVPLRLVNVNGDELRATAAGALERASTRARLSTGTARFAMVCSCRGRLGRFPEVSEPEFLFTHAGKDLVGLAGWYGFGEVGMTRRGTAAQRNWAISVVVLADELDSEATDQAAAQALKGFQNLMQHTQESAHGDSAFARALVHRHERSRWDILAGKIADVAGAVECSIFFHDDSDGEGRFILAGTNAWQQLVWEGGRSLDEVAPWMLYYKAGDGYTGWVAESGRVLNVQRRDGKTLEEAAKREGWAKPPRLCAKGYIPNKSMAFLAVPILSSRRTIGVLRLSSVRGDRLGQKAFFTVQDERFLEVCASFLSTMQAGVLTCDLRPLLDGLGRASHLVEHALRDTPVMLHTLIGRLPESSELRPKLDVILKTLANTAAHIEGLRREPLQGQRIRFTELVSGVCVDSQLWAGQTAVISDPEDPTDDYSISGHTDLLKLALEELIRNACRAQARKIVLRMDRDREDRRVHLAVYNDGGLMDDNKIGLGTGVLFCQCVALRHGAWFGYESPIRYGRKHLGSTAAHYVFPRRT